MKERKRERAGGNEGEKREENEGERKQERGEEVKKRKEGKNGGDKKTRGGREVKERKEEKLKEKEREGRGLKVKERKEEENEGDRKQELTWRQSHPSASFLTTSRTESTSSAPATRPSLLLKKERDLNFIGNYYICTRGPRVHLRGPLYSLCHVISHVCRIYFFSNLCQPISAAASLSYHIPEVNRQAQYVVNIKQTHNLCKYELLICIVIG
jgi:hypothetical protein